jgi:hypothetical protein
MKSHRSPDIESFQTGPGHHVTKHGVDQRELYHDARTRPISAAYRLSATRESVRSVN